jgi:hypothetical protein
LSADPAPAPFIVGAPRSGTTMLRLMLDAHPDLAIPPETYFAVAARDAWVRAREAGGDPVAALVEAVTSHRRWPGMGVDASAFAARVKSVAPEGPGDALRCFFQLYAESRGKPRWGDKTPNYAKRIRMIHRLLPEARFVHLIRDGRAWARSILGLWIGPDTIEGCAREWVAVIDKARRQAAQLPAGRYLELRYEDLVREPDASLRRVADLLELPFDDRMLRFHEHASERERGVRLETSRRGDPIDPDVREGLGANLTKPPDPALIDRWRVELDPADIRTFDSIAGERLRELGYGIRE